VKKGIFISFEGPEGGGKSTHIRDLECFLENNGIKTLRTREPGGTRLGEVVRDLLQNNLAGEAPSSRAEVMLFAASRAQLCENVIRPALDEGTWVLADRYADSTYAYQGYARGFNLADLKEITRFATGSLVPDLTILLDLPPEASRQRLAARANAPDRIESEGEEFHLKVRNGFLELARDNPERYAVIDARDSREAVSALIEAEIKARFPNQVRS
jgi:dTMP kinase